MSKTVLDEWVVQLGLDVAGLAKGQTDALARLDAIEKGADKSRKNIEASNKKTGESFEAITRGVFRLTTAFVGFSAIKAAVVDITKADIAVGRFAANIDAPIGKIKALRSAAGELGIAASEIDAAMLASADAVAKMRIGIMPSSEYMRAMGMFHVKPSEFLSKDIDDLERYKLVQDGVNTSIKEGRMTRMEAITFGGLMGYSSNVIAMMIETNGQTDELIAKYLTMNKLSKEDEQMALTRAKVWNEVTNSIESAFRSAANGMIRLAAAGVAEGKKLAGDKTAFASGGQVYQQAATHVVTGKIKRAGDTSLPSATGDTSPPSGEQLQTYAAQLDAEFKLPHGTMRGVLGGEGTGGGQNTGESPKGAQGAWQLMAPTAAHYGVDPNDYKSSGRAAAALMQELLGHYGGNQAQAYGGYNAGQPNFDAMLKSGRMADETRGYIPRAMSAMRGASAVGGSSSTSSTTIGVLNVNAGSANGRDVAAGLNNGNIVRNAVAMNSNWSGM